MGINPDRHTNDADAELTNICSFTVGHTMRRPPRAERTRI